MLVPNEKGPPELFGAQAPPSRSRSSHLTGSYLSSPLGVSKGRQPAGQGNSGCSRHHFGGGGIDKASAKADDQVGQDGNGRKATDAVMRYGC